LRQVSVFPNLAWKAKRGGTTKLWRKKMQKPPFISEARTASRLPSHSDFTGGCGFSPHRLLGLLDLSELLGITTGRDLPCPKN